MQTWVQSQRGREAAVQVEAILELLLDMKQGRFEMSPNTHIDHMVLDAWAQCEAREGTGYAAKRASSILA